MKLSHLLLAGGAATLSYLAVKHREKIVQEAQETLSLIQNMEGNYSNIQEQLATIQSYQEPLQELADDFQYKWRVYQQSISGNLAEIRKIQEKYQTKDEQED